MRAGIISGRARQPYNQIRYTTVPNANTHPDRLAAVGTLFGMSPAPMARCRVLEIGCGDGSNLVPMAYALPESRFLGVDLAREPIEAGRRTVAVLGLGNISLEAADLCDIGAQAGELRRTLESSLEWMARGGLLEA